MSFDSFFFLLKSAVNNLFRNLLLTLASILVLVLCLVILGSTLLVVDNVNVFVEEIGENQVAVFLDESFTQEQIDGFMTQLAQIGNIEEITYETKEQALQNYMESLGDDYFFENPLEADTFRDSVLFKIQDLTKYEQTMYEVKKLDGIANVRERKDLVARILELRETVAFLSICIVLLFFFVSVFIITVSVKLSVFSRRLEINIMKYVGAADYFIQLPYFIEGMLIGLAAGTISLFVEIYLYQSVLFPLFADFGMFAPVSMSANMPFWLLFFLGAGTVVGIIGSVFPVKKYLKV